MKRLRLTLVTITLSLSLIGLVTLPTQAQTPAEETGQALEIAPPIATLTLDPGETTTLDIMLRNVSTAEQIATAEVNDFVASGETGTPRLLLDEEDAEDNPYSIGDWVKPLPPVLLVPGEVKSIPVTITAPDNAAPGGHYGVIRFSASAPELEGTGVALSASVGTLVLATVNGDTVEKLEIEELSINKEGKTGSIFESTPLQFVQRIKNSGNNHIQPSGQVTISDMFGRTVATLNVNLPPRYILPGSIRKFEQPLDSSVIGDKWLFGRYTADLELTYGADGQTLSDSFSFWVIPSRLIGFTIVGLIIAFFAARFGLRRYNERVIEKARRR